MAQIQSLAQEPPYASSVAIKRGGGSSHCGAVDMSPTDIHKDAGWIPDLAQWVKDPVLP